MSVSLERVAQLFMARAAQQDNKMDTLTQQLHRKLDTIHNIIVSDAQQRLPTSDWKQSDDAHGQELETAAHDVHTEPYHLPEKTTQASLWANGTIDSLCSVPYIIGTEHTKPASYNNSAVSSQTLSSAYAPGSATYIATDIASDIDTDIAMVKHMHMYKGPGMPVLVDPDKHVLSQTLASAHALDIATSTTSNIAAGQHTHAYNSPVLPVLVDPDKQLHKGQYCPSWQSP